MYISGFWMVIDLTTLENTKLKANILVFTDLQFNHLQSLTMYGMT